MPMQFEQTASPSGLGYLRIEVEGPVDLADGNALEAALDTGRSHHGGFLFSRIAAGTEYSPEVRRYFSRLDGKVEAAAVVVTSPIVRAAINMMIRFMRKHGNVRMFTDDDEALAWLEHCARSPR